MKNVKTISVKKIYFRWEANHIYSHSDLVLSFRSILNFSECTILPLPYLLVSLRNNLLLFVPVLEILCSFLLIYIKAILIIYHRSWNLESVLNLYWLLNTHWQICKYGPHLGTKKAASCSLVFACMDVLRHITVLVKHLLAYWPVFQSLPMELCFTVNAKE